MRTVVMGLDGHPDLPLAATKKIPWPLQSVTGFVSRRTAMLPFLPIIFGLLRGARYLDNYAQTL